jgi:hypothetical protein
VPRARVERFGGDDAIVERQHVGADRLRRLVPLPAITTMSSAPASATAAKIAARRSGSTTSPRSVGIPLRTSSMISSGSSPRGLSEVRYS